MCRILQGVVAASEPCVICILAFLRQAFSRRLAPSPWKNDKLSFVMVRICTRGKLAEPTYHAYHLISRPPAHFKNFPAERPSYIVFFHLTKTQPLTALRSAPGSPNRPNRPNCPNPWPNRLPVGPCPCCVLVGPQDTLASQEPPDQHLSGQP